MQSDPCPLVSVVIPAHNSARFIVQALESVFAQTYSRYEVLVVDDGSTDDTAEVLRRFGNRLRYHRQTNRGPSAARNAAITLSAGALVCFLDADDAWRPDKLARQVEFMKAHPEVGLLFSDSEEWDDAHVVKASLVSTSVFATEVLSQVPLSGAFRRLIVDNFIPTSTVMIRKACFTQAGLFDETLVSVEDRDLWLRIAARSPVACLPSVLARKRRHDANISDNAEVALRSRVRVWSKARKEFPDLVPGALYDALLAPTYQQLGFIALARGDTSTARRSGIAAVTHAIRGTLMRQRRRSYSLAASIGLVGLSLLPWPMVRAAWRTKNRLSGKTLPARQPVPLR